MTRDDLARLIEGVSHEAQGVLEAILDKGEVTITADSSELAILYAYDEIITSLWLTLHQKEAHMRALADA